MRVGVFKKIDTKISFPVWKHDDLLKIFYERVMQCCEE